jgi:hypothetical protein
MSAEGYKRALATLEAMPIKELIAGRYSRVTDDGARCCAVGATVPAFAELGFGESETVISLLRSYVIAPKLEAALAAAGLSEDAAAEMQHVNDSFAAEQPATELATRRARLERHAHVCAWLRTQIAEAAS